MSIPGQYSIRNRLLSLLPEQDFLAVRSHLEPVDLPRQTVLSDPVRRVDFVYFLENGIGSLVASSPDSHMAEAGLFGYEGFAPVAPALGVDRSSHKVVIQVAGSGYRVRLDAMLQLLESSRAFRTLLTRYTHTLVTQISYTALSNAVHQIDERLGRWLLMCHDRAEGDNIAITHEFIALMLAVRRPSVTTALHVLEGEGFIRSERGFVTIRNRSKLEEFCRDAYGKPEREYERLIGPMKLVQRQQPVERMPMRTAALLRN